MAGLLDNFTLGLKGVADLGAHALGFETTFAADEYAAQVGQGAESYSRRIDNLRAEGKKAEAARLAEAAAKKATAEGAVQEAARQTAKQVKSYATRGLWIAAAIAVPVLAVGAWIYTAPARAVAR